MEKRKTSIEARVVLLVEKAEARNGIWTLTNPVMSLGMAEERLPELYLYTQLTGGLGRYNLQVQVRAFDSDFAVHRSAAAPVDFSEDRTLIEERVFRFVNLPFPKSETYEFQLMANYVEVENGAYYLSVIRTN